MSTERAGMEPLGITLRTTMEIPGLEERAHDREARKRLGARIRATRQSRGLRLKDLAARIGMPLSSLARLEMGEAPWPGPERLGALARALEVWMRELAGEAAAGRQEGAPLSNPPPPSFVIFDEGVWEDLFG